MCFIFADSLPVTQLDRSLLRDIMMEYSISSEGTYMIETSWEQIGIQLEVADEELESIRKRRTSKGGLCDFTLAFRDTIRIWVKQETPPPTWSRFVEALERLKKFPKLADHLRSKYCMYAIIIMTLKIIWRLQCNYHRFNSEH